MWHQPNDDSTAVGKERCPSCTRGGGDWDGDNLVRYSDGHGYCFACGFYERGDGEPVQDNNHNHKGGRRVAGELLPTGDFVPLTKRKINEDTCRKFGYHKAKLKSGKSAQVAPYFDSSGKLVAQHIRDAEKNFIWLGSYKEGQLFGQHLWGEGGRRVIITEGEIDCMTISQLQDNKWPVVSIKSGANAAVNDIKASLEWLESYQEVIFCFDMDEPGRKAAQDCAALLTPGKAHIVHLPLKDANECLLAGKVKELTSALWNAKPYRPDGIVSIKDLKEKSKQAAPPGLPISFQELSDKLYGIRPKELYLFTAGSGIGKSTIVHEIAFELHQRHGWSLGVLALEEANAKTVRRYVGIAMNKPLTLPGYEVPEDEYDAAFDKIAGRDDIWFYDHFGSTDVDGILSKLRYLAVVCGVKCIVLDHISIVVSGLDEVGESERKTIDKLMTRLRSLVEETGVTVLAVVHLKRPDKGKSWNEGREPSLTDLRGSGSLEQLSDVVIALERDQQGDNANLSGIRILKNRPVGITGKAGKAVYNQETGRLIPTDTDESPFCDETGNGLVCASLGQLMDTKDF